MADDLVSEKLALTREEFARFDGRVTATLDNIQSDLTEVKGDVRTLKDRMSRLETTGRVTEKIKLTWREWVVAIVAIGALVLNIVRR